MQEHARERQPVLLRHQTLLRLHRPRGHAKFPPEDDVLESHRGSNPALQSFSDFHLEASDLRHSSNRAKPDLLPAHCSAQSIIRVDAAEARAYQSPSRRALPASRYRGRGSSIDTTPSTGNPQEKKCPSTSRASAAARPAITPSKRLRPASPRRPYRKRKRGAASSKSKRRRSTGLKDFAGSRPASLGGPSRLEMIQGCEDGNGAA